MVQYPTVNNNADLEFLSTPQCKVRNSSYEFAVLSKNKILRDFWETQSLKNGLNRRFLKKIASLWLRHLRFESLLRVYNAIKPVTSFCQVFKVEICEANTTVTWQVDIICQKKSWKFSSFFIYFSLFLLVFMMLIYLEFCDILSMLALVLKGTTATINKYKGYV